MTLDSFVGGCDASEVAGFNDDHNTVLSNGDTRRQVDGGNE